MNTAILIGRLTKDPELRYIPSTGRPVATFTIAVDRAFKKDGQKQTDFFNIVVWGNQAESCANYLGKGSQVAIKGSIQNRSYETNNGEKRYVTEIIADNVQFLGSPSNGNDTHTEKSAPYQPSEIDGYTALEEDDVPF